MAETKYDTLINSLRSRNASLRDRPTSGIPPQKPFIYVPPLIKPVQTKQSITHLIAELTDCIKEYKACELAKISQDLKFKPINLTNVADRELYNSLADINKSLNSCNTWIDMQINNLHKRINIIKADIEKNLQSPNNADFDTTTGINYDEVFDLMAKYELFISKDDNE